MLGGYASDLVAGDVFEPVEYELTSFICSDYAHGAEEDCEWYHSARTPWGRQIRPPTMVHVDKMRLIRKNCPKDDRLSGLLGKAAFIHYEYDAQHHSPAFVGEILVVSGGIRDKFVKRGRTYLGYYVEVHTSDGRLISTYSDKTLLDYKPEGATS